MKKYTLKVLVLLPVFTVLLSGCKSEETYVSQTRMFFGFDTEISVQLFNADYKDFSSVGNIIETYSKLCDNYQSYEGLNNIYTINNSDEAIKVDSELFDLLSKANAYHELTNGYFNPLTGKLNKLWKENIAKNEIPAQNLIENAVNEINSSQLILNEADKTVQIIGAAELDLGAVAKGYVLDIVKAYLDENEINCYLINAGTSSLALGVNPKREKGVYRLGFDDVFGYSFTAKNQFVSTSSNKRLNAVIDGVKYSHIINPFTGSAKTINDFVVLKGDKNSGMLDAMTTAMVWMDKEAIISLCNTHNLDVAYGSNGKFTYYSENMGVEKN